MAYRSQFGLGAAEAVITKITYGGEVDPSACIDGYDRYGVACQDWSSLSDPGTLATAKQILSGGGASSSATKINPLYIAGGLVALVLVVSMMGGRRR